MKTCCNCNNPFKVKANKRGFHRFPISGTLPGTSITAKDLLENLTSSTFTPQTKRKGKFLCTVCWSSIHQAFKYQQAIHSFCKEMDPSSYLASKGPMDSHLPGTSSFKQELSKDTETSSFPASEGAMELEDSQLPGPSGFTRPVSSSTPAADESKKVRLIFNHSHIRNATRKPFF